MKRISVLLIISTLLLLLAQGVAFATPIEQYLCELGVAFYHKGDLENALSEFKKVLLINPANQTAQNYINTIFQAEKPAPVKRPQASRPPLTAQAPPQQPPDRNEAIDRAFRYLRKDRTRPDFTLEAKKPEFEFAGVKISGEAQARFGVTPQNNSVWKRANWDLNERNYRRLSNEAFNRQENTYDPRIYDRLSFNVDSGHEEGLNFHANVTVDPWSFTGKSDKISLVGASGDVAQIQLKYWANTGYTINETVNTFENGDTFSLPEIKVKDWKIGQPISIKSSANNVFTLPEMKIYREFQPVREFWADYTSDNLELKVFPMAYENQAVTLDDPLRLSNNRIWWEDSPWLHSWRPGILNLGVSPEDFTKGRWDNKFSFFTRDSEGRRLTALRGFSLNSRPLEDTSIVVGMATPKNIWQDYTDLDNFVSAVRLKQGLWENVQVGLSATTRLGFNLGNRNKIDAWNGVSAADIAYEVVDGLKASAEVAQSQAKYDLTTKQYRTKSSGFAYYFSLIGRYPFTSILDTEYGYEGIRPEKEESNFTKFRFIAARMDPSFDASLSSYVETRDDEWWSRHLHFRMPFEHYYQGEGELLNWDSIKAYAVGNGIDTGRSVMALRIESALLDKDISNFFDVRNVHNTNHKFIENVVRDELSWNINDRLTTKFLGIYHRLPETKAGTDPYIFDPISKRFVANSLIEDGKDPSVATGSLGIEYEFSDQVALNGIYEFTNDISLGLDNFPRSLLLNDTTSNYLYTQYDNRYRDMNKFLYSQQFFPKPPYPYFNVFKSGLRLKPTEKVQIYLDYTRNPFEKAGQLDDNMNHVGFELAYTPLEKLSLFFRYAYSRWQDLDKLVQGNTKLFGHHNFFAELIYRVSKDEDFSFQYGEGSRDPFMGGVLTVGWDPYGSSSETIDTQHIVRMYYRRRF